MTDASQPSRELESLLAALCDDRLSPDQSERLETLLRSSRDARRYYIKYMHLHCAVGRYCASGSVEPVTARNEIVDFPGEVFVASRVAETMRAESDKAVVVSEQGDGGGALLSPHFPRILGPWSLAAVSAVVCVAVALGIVLNRVEIISREGQASAAVVVAELTSDHGCVWAGRQGAFDVGSKLSSGERVELVKGVAKLAFQGGATVVVKSPAVFEPVTAMSVRVQRGSLVVRSDGPRKDFTVISPEASIVDLGTSFGVCAGDQGVTDVEVFEGKVEVQTEAVPRNRRILGLGEAVQVRRGKQGTRINTVAAREEQFADLLAVIWDDIRQVDDGGTGSVVVADFDDAQHQKKVDSFYGSTPGRGWLTPWLAGGNPKGVIRRDDALSGEGDPYLSLKFGRANGRVIAREYGRRSDFDPSKPHVISWRWRFEGDPKQFGGHYQDRILFYGAPTLRHNTGDNSWIIGVVGAADETPPPKGPELRHFFPMRWFVYDRHGDESSKMLDGRDMIDTGMEFKPNVVYQFAVVVYPDESRYDAAIRDDEKTFSRTGLLFRFPKSKGANVIHFNIRTAKEKKDLGFSLDSVRIEQLQDGGLKQGIEPL